MYRNTAFVTSSAVIVPSMDSFSNCSIRSFCVTFSPPSLTFTHYIVLKQCVNIKHKRLSHQAIVFYNSYINPCSTQ